MTRPWYVLTGAPSSGKSTLIAELSKRGYTTIAEQGKQEIDHQLAAGKRMAEIKVDSASFELGWTARQARRELAADPDQLTFLDRGMLDTLAYFAHYGWKIPDVINERCAQAAYKKVFLLEILDYKTDYYRVETAETAKAMEERFAQAYADAGYEVVRIPALPVVQRVKLVLEHL